MSEPHSDHLSLATCASLACLWEALAAKPGNVHRGADFDDLSFADLATAGVVIGPHMEAATTCRVGETVLRAIQATRNAVATNANLGIVLLFAPVATVPRDVSVFDGIDGVLARLDDADARDVFAAIRLANPGGLGRVDEADVSEAPSVPLVEAMRLAAGRDLVARQYASGFRDVLDRVVPWLKEGFDREEPLSQTIVRCHLRLMAELPDSLILRKCGPATAKEASDRAARVLSYQEQDAEAYEQGLAELDFWLRADGHRRNPGATADLVACGLFVALREGLVRPPYRFYTTPT